MNNNSIGHSSCYTPSSFTLDEDEVLVKMDETTNGVVLDQVTFHSNKGKVYGPYGKTGETQFSIQGLEIVSVFGNQGSYNLVDGLGVCLKN